MTGRSPRHHDRSPERGFTLFEVLAAVLVLALIYTWLASINMQGLRAEGTSRRRLEASLLADGALAGVEEQMALGLLPPIGTTEQEAGDFQILVTATPLDITPWLGEEALPPEEVSESLLTLPSTGAEPFLRRIDVSVRWMEGVDEFEVHRTTFAYDPEVLASVFPEEEQQAGENPLEGIDEDTPREEALEAMREQLERMGGASR